MAKQQASYSALIPNNLHSQVEQLLSYLTYYPFEKPTECHHCGSSNIHYAGDNSRRDKSILELRCRKCKRAFNRLTNTIFANTYYLEQWGEFGKLYLTGMSVISIAKQLNMAKSTAMLRRTLINKLMKEKYPELFQWWHTHHTRQVLSFTAEIAKESEQFMAWLKQLFNKNDYQCPNCNIPMCRQNTNRPYFACGRCDYFLSPVSKTLLKGIRHMDKWLDYSHLLIKGFGNKDISHTLKIGVTTSPRWRQLFIKQMQLLGFNNLVHWLNWQQHRRQSTRDNKEQFNELNKYLQKKRIFKR